MHKTISAIVALALLASVAPFAQADEANYAERNIEWFIETYDLDDYSMDTQGTLFGETITLGEALETIGERSARVDLAAATAGAAGHGGHAGDIWATGLTNGCPADNVIAPGHGQFVPIDEQLWLYEYDVQQNSASGAIVVIGWTDKSVGAYGSIEVIGITDNFCFEFFGIGLYFPYINGIVQGV